MFPKEFLELLIRNKGYSAKRDFAKSNDKK
jgi:hypothetical protein